MEKLYKILKTYECPTGRIHVGVAKTEEEWQKVFPNLEKGDCGIKQDWFECVGSTVDAGTSNCVICDVSHLFGERYEMCKDQPAQIDCREENCKCHKNGSCHNISPALTIHKGHVTCWSGRSEPNCG